MGLYWVPSGFLGQLLLFILSLPPLLYASLPLPPLDSFQNKAIRKAEFWY